MTEPVFAPCFLYRFFGADDALLYVGVADDVARRLAQHRATAEWWPAAVRGELRCYPTRGAALQAEAIAITVEKPQRNAQIPRVRDDRPLELSPAEQTRLVVELERARADAEAARQKMVRAQGMLDTARRRLDVVTGERDHYRRMYWDQAKRESEACVMAYLRGRDERPAEADARMVER
jgi:predicted GIY-YIG superfamily endonuclease